MKRDEIKENWHLLAPTEDGVGINAVTDGSSKGGEGVAVVIFDTGVEFRHPSLRPNIDMERARDFDHDLDGRGRSWSAGGRIDNPLDAHGTACAGIVGAVAVDDKRAEGINEDCKVVGVAPRCTLVPVRISANFETDSLIAALRYAAEVGDIVLLPRFMRHSGRLDAVITEITAHVPVICASGNDGIRSLVYPASHPGTIAVGACNDRGYRSTYSQYGKGLDVVAPSNDTAIETRSLVRLDRDEVARRLEARAEVASLRAGNALNHFARPDDKQLSAESQAHGWHLETMGELSIATTDNLRADGYNFEPSGDYCKAGGEFGFGGTSAAAAQVAGVVALMIGANGGLRGRPASVRDILRGSASTEFLKAGVSTLDDEFGWGLVDAQAAQAKAEAA